MAKLIPITVDFTALGYFGLLGLAIHHDSHNGPAFPNCSNYFEKHSSVLDTHRALRNFFSVHPLYGKNWFTCSQDLTV